MEAQLPRASAGALTPAATLLPLARAPAGLRQAEAGGAEMGAAGLHAGCQSRLRHPGTLGKACPLSDLRLSHCLWLLLSLPTVHPPPGSLERLPAGLYPKICRAVAGATWPTIQPRFKYLMASRVLRGPGNWVGEGTGLRQG